MTEESEKYLCDKVPCLKGEDDCYIEPCTIWTFWKRLPELVTDPSCNQLSASRGVLFLCGCCTVALTWAAIAIGKIEAVTGLVSTVAGIVAGIYFASTVKD